MKIAIDRAGRIVVPKKIRDSLGLAPETGLEIKITGMRIELEPKPMPIKFEQRGKLLVAVPQCAQPALTLLQVNQATHQLREGDAPITRKRGQRSAR